MSGKTWQLQDAQNRFSNLVNSAQKKGLQIVANMVRKLL